MHFSRTFLTVAVVALILRVSGLLAETGSPDADLEKPVACIDPAAVADPTPAGLIRAIGGEARATAQQASLPQIRLLELAKAQIAARDVAGARESLTQAQSLSTSAPSKAVFAELAVTLWVKLGDAGAARAVIDRAQGDVQTSLIADAISAEAELGDFEAALGLAHRDEMRPWWFADIAAKQCQAGLRAGKDTLVQATDKARAAAPQRRKLAALALPGAFAACGDVAGAVAIARELDPDGSDSDIGYASHHLLTTGDLVAARALGEARSGEVRPDALEGLELVMFAKARLLGATMPGRASPWRERPIFILRT
jgi:hypothetical protein